MPDIERGAVAMRGARNDLVRARAALDRAEVQAAQLTHRVQQLVAELETTRARRADTANVSRRMKDARAAAERAHRAVSAARRNLADIVRGYAPHVTEEATTGELDPSIPLVLLPFRLETRFQQAGAANELWIRIYPDDCSIDAFEANLSETEVESTRRFWSAYYAAGGDDNQERAAWRDLCASHGSGRATWLVEQLRPGNLGARPAKAVATDQLLVIVTSDLPDQATRDALGAYWAAVWTAAGNTAAIDAALVALQAALGFDPAHLLTQYVPANIDANPAAPLTRADVGVDVAWLQLAAVALTKSHSWSEPARVRLLPERFVVVGYKGGNELFRASGNVIHSDLVASPDPSAPIGDQFAHDASGELIVPPTMRWLVDFDEAVRVGMGMKVPLPAGWDVDDAVISRIVAIGVRAEDAGTGASGLATLLMHQSHTGGGISVLPQGTPTNNTDHVDSGLSRRDDPDGVWDAMKLGPVARSVDWWTRSDGEWLSDLLGIPLETFTGIAHARGTDQVEARAMQRALWPTTMGYSLATNLYPMFTAEQIEAVRWFAQHFVSGRGFVPSLRIGRQPYGILPISAPGALDARQRPAGLEPPNSLRAVAPVMDRVLDQMRDAWRTLAEKVAYLGKPGDQGQVLLDVLGLHPSSVEFHQRHAESLDQVYNHGKFLGLSDEIAQVSPNLAAVSRARDLLRSYGYTDKLPDGLSRFWYPTASRLNGPVIDDAPLSERDPIREWTADGRNYVEWLSDAASSLEDLRLERGFKNGHPPDALLYLLLRHALLLSYYEVGLGLRTDAGVLDQAQARAAMREAPFVHVQAGGPSESRWQALYQTDAAVTGDDQVTIGEYVGAHPQAADGQLADQIAALDLLKHAPTARLERCLAEHIDIASHRLDAWLLGRVHYALAAVRYPPEREGAPRPGVHIGAYACVENLHRSSARPEGARPRGVLAREQARLGSPLWHEPSNAGFIFAPSLAQATTAAMLRAGYLANATKDDPSVLSVNLSSRRVRLALEVIGGIRTGQPLGALLGYRLERALHHRTDGLELDRYTYAFRQRFPLVANQMESTKEDAPVEALEASNVPDGKALAEAIRASNATTFPFGLDLPAASTSAEAAAVTAAVAELLDTYDAIADLALSESVHQAGSGNYDRAGPTLEAYTKGTFPPEPAVTRTPRSGFGLTHRVAVHFPAGVAPDARPEGNIAPTPRSRAQAMANAWLVGALPPSDHIGCRVSWIDPLDGSAHERIVTQRDLRLQPIDLVHMGSVDADRAMRELDDRITRHVLANEVLRADTLLSLDHATRLATGATFFEIAALMRELRSILLHSRPLQPTDVSTSLSARRGADRTLVIDPARVRPIRADLAALQRAVDDYVLPPNVGDCDDLIDDVVELFERAARFGIKQVGWGFMYEWRRKTFSDLSERVRVVRDRWSERIAQFDQGLAQYDNDAPGLSERERLTRLGQLDLLVASSQRSPQPTSAADYRAIVTTRRTTFGDARDALSAILTTADPKVSALVAAVRAQLPFDDFDPRPFDLDGVDTALQRLADDVQRRLTALRKELADRLKNADAALGRHDATADPGEKVDAISAAASALLGDDMRLVPEFTLDGDAAAGLATAVAASDELLTYVKGQGRHRPVDDWMHGAARVREKLHAWEQSTLFAPLVGGQFPTLTPMQLPYVPGETWLAMEFDQAHVPDSDRLLYTASLPTGFDPTLSTSGMLVDDWTEVVPTSEGTAALAFHFPSPRARPPQSWLLVVPRGHGWSFDEVLEAIEQAFELARIRAVEPAHIESSPFGAFLPATVSASTLPGITISMNLTRVNNFAAELRHDA